MHNWTDKQFERERNRIGLELHRSQKQILKLRRRWFWWARPSIRAEIYTYKIKIGACLHAIELLDARREQVSMH